MSGRSKVIVIPLDTLAAILRGDKRALNIPHDAYVQFYIPVKDDPIFRDAFALRVTSEHFDFIGHGDLMAVTPIVTTGDEVRPVLKLHRGAVRA